MNKRFEHRALLEIGTLRQLQARRDLPFVVRLTVHLASSGLLCIAVPTVYEQALLAAACAVALAWVWSFVPGYTALHTHVLRDRNRLAADPAGGFTEA